MRIVSIILLTGCLMVLAGIEILPAQSTVRGDITDVDTRKPLKGAHIYLSGTTIGTAARGNGDYQLEQIPAGGYRLVVSMVGYSTKIVDVVIDPEESRKMDFELNPVTYKLPEIYVGNLDEEWEENLDRFSEHFIGGSVWSDDSVNILNPEVLRFDKKWWGRLTAEAMAPLRIENRALGYYITYHLKEFEHTGTRTRWDGEPLFREMIPADSAQAAYWEQNRRDAFYGSLRHFLLALLTDRVKEEGFILYNNREAAYGVSSDNQWRTSAEQLIGEGEEPYLYHLNFFGQLEITYTNEEEDPGYLRWKRSSRRNIRNAQTSYLELNEHPVTVDTDGEIIQPYGATQFGYFAYSRLAVLTPRGYRPKGYGVSNEE